MKRNLVTGLLITLLVLTCLILTGILLGGSWLSSYQVFTEKKLVANVTVSAKQQDENGEYANIIYQPINDTAATNYLFSPVHVVNNGDRQDFKIYGDSVHIGGPIIKLHDNLILFNFQTIYKVGAIFGKYNLDAEHEQRKTVASNYELNGGIDGTWKDSADHIDEFPRNMFFVATQISTPGVIFEDSAKEYAVYITDAGFAWEEAN